MSSLLGEPFLLANYPVPPQNIPKSPGTFKTHSHRYVGVQGSRSDHGEGFATVTVQGDGIHVLELSNMHPIVSHTLGPSAFFAAPAATRLNGSGTSTSYAVMRAAPDGVNKADRDRTMWKWRDNNAKRPDEQPEPKRTAVFPHRIEEIWMPDRLPSNVIAISPSGDVMLSDDDLNITSSIAVSDSRSILLKSFVFSSNECAFLSHRPSQHSEVVVMCFIMVASRIKLRITMAHSAGELEKITECDLGIHEDVIDISCDPSGYTTILAQGGEWQFFRLCRDSADTVIASSLNTTLSLTGLSSPLLVNVGRWVVCGPTIISVGSSFVLLAGMSGDDPPEVVLLLWDIQYQVVLATQKFALPSMVAYSPSSPLRLELTPASGSLALLVLSPAITTSSKGKVGVVSGHSAILLVPIAVPPMSTIALAMGRARDTQMWLRNIHDDKTCVTVLRQDKGRRQVMQSVREALAKDCPQAAEVAFFAWVNQETAHLKHLQNVEVPSNESNRDNRGDGEQVPNRQNQGHSIPPLSHQFVSNILNEILRPSDPSYVSYPSKIMQYLLSREAVSHGMVEGGLLPALRHHQDWDSIASALENVHDLPEGDLISLLVEVVKSHRLLQNPDPKGMQVDPPSGTPSLPNFLAMLVGYISSSAMLRLAVKTHLTDAKDIVCILEVLEDWLVLWCDTKTGPAIDLGNLSLERAQTPNTTKRTRSTGRDEPPLLGPVTAFLQSVLDVHFLTLLQYAPSHTNIEKISRHVHEQLLYVEDMDRLRGPLEAFVSSQSRKSRGHHRELKGGGISRQRHKEASEAAELAVGLYQVEELVI